MLNLFFYNTETQSLKLKTSVPPYLCVLNFNYSLFTPFPSKARLPVACHSSLKKLPCLFDGGQEFLLTFGIKAALDRRHRKDNLHPYLPSLLLHRGQQRMGSNTRQLTHRLDICPHVIFRLWSPATDNHTQRHATVLVVVRIEQFQRCPTAVTHRFKLGEVSVRTRFYLTLPRDSWTFDNVQRIIIPQSSCNFHNSLIVSSARFHKAKRLKECLIVNA